MHRRATRRAAFARRSHPTGGAWPFRAPWSALCRHRAHKRVVGAATMRHGCHSALRVRSRNSPLPSSRHSRAQQEQGTSARAARTEVQEPPPANIHKLSGGRIRSLRKRGKAHWFSLRKSRALSPQSRVTRSSCNPPQSSGEICGSTESAVTAH